MTKTPEEWLEEVSPKERTEGILKLFLGYAPGVGKTFSMLSEAIRRRSRGEDVVIGVVETHGRKGIAELASQLEQVPRRKIEYKGTIFEEMDPDAIKARNPRVVLVDELAHTNIPGQQTPQAVRRRAGPCRGENGSTFHRQRAAPRKHRPHRRRDHRNQDPRNRAGLGDGTRQ